MQVEETWGEALHGIWGYMRDASRLLWAWFMVTFRFTRHIFHLVTMTLATSLFLFCVVRFIIPFDF
jgi:hypothetical protein